MNESDTQPDAYQASGTSPPVALSQPHNRRESIAEGFKNRTRGEAAFNFRTYVGLGYFGSIVASVLLTWALRDNKTISPKFQKMTNAIAEWSAKGLSGEAKAARIQTVNSNATILSMFTGTTLMAVFPIKWLEDHKASIIKRLDKQFYGEERVKSDPALIEAHRMIDEAPKQTWKSIIGSRVVAFAATIGTSLLIGSNSSRISKMTGQSIDKISIEAGRWTDRLLHGKNSAALRDIEAAAAASPHELTRTAPADRTTSRIFSYLALDGLYTILTGAVLFVFTRILAPVFDKNIPAHAPMGSAGGAAPSASAPTAAQHAVNSAEAEHDSQAQPQTKISQASRAETRLADANTHALTA